MGTGRALRQRPGLVVLEQHVEVAVVPLGRVGSPGALNPAGDGVSTHTGSVVAGPAEALLFKRCTFRLGALVVFRSGAVRLTEGVTASSQGNGFLIVHGHPLERLTDVLSAEERVGVRVGPLRVDVDETHLHGGEGVLKVLAGVAVAVVAEPLVFTAPVDVVFRVPDVGSATAESKHGAAHGLDGDLAGEDQQVSPTDGVAVLLLDRPEKASGLVEVAVIGPAVEWGKALSSSTAAATAVAGSVGTCCVPSHANEERPVMTVVGRPPVLAVRHQGVEILLEALVVEALEGFSVVKIRVHGVGLGVVLVEDVQIEVLGPPILVGSHVRG